MSDAYRFLARSQHRLAKLARRLYRAAGSFGLPAPRLVVRPLLAVFLAARGLYHFLARVLVCEPLFKAYCTRYGRNLRTDVYIHWIQGPGEILIGDDVIVDGKCAFTFASQAIREIGGLAQLTPDQDFYDAGFTSVRALDLLLELETRFGVSLPDEGFRRRPDRAYPSCPGGRPSSRRSAGAVTRSPAAVLRRGREESW